jgi:AraC family transcriptional regulator
MAITAQPLLRTDTVAAWDWECPSLGHDKAVAEHVSDTRITFPYRGVYVHQVGTKGIVAEPNQMVIVHEGEPFGVSHPVVGGHAALSVAVDPATLWELAPV